MVTDLEKVVYLVPIVFFVLENVWIYLIKHEIDRVSITLEVLILPVVTSFYLIVVSQISFTIMILLSVCVLITALFAERAEREKVFSTLVVMAIVLTFVEYWLLLK